MPSSDAILAAAAAIANDWRTVAVGWHALLIGLLLSLTIGWAPSTRLIGILLAAPLVSVGALAWTTGNVFNAAVFTFLAALLIVAAYRTESAGDRRRARFSWTGAALVAFGSVYPHFLVTRSPVEYVYAAPFGLLPCPTLAVVMGMAILVDVRSIAWLGIVAVAGAIYAIVGVAALGVTLDYALLAGALAVALHAASLSTRADPDERHRALPGDEFIPVPLGSFTHAVTIRARANAVWPWLAQMGAGTRAGWYSYDSLDNGGRRSAAAIIPELQHIAIGSIFPALPGETKGFEVLDFHAARWIVLGWRAPDSRALVTWTFVLDERTDGSTRLLVRARGSAQYRFRALAPAVSKHIARAIHFVMERRQLIGIAWRAEHVAGERTHAREQQAPTSRTLQSAAAAE